MRAMWKGTVSFGLVAIPVQLYAAVEGKSPSFRQVHVTDGGRIHYKRVCSVDGEEVPYAEIAKGYELGDDQMVVLTDDDLADLPVPSVKTVDVVEFVPLEAIDPIYFDHSYYLEPQRAAVKAYTLLRDAISKSGQVAVAKIALRQRESLAVLRVYQDTIVLNTMVWPDEVRQPDFGFLQAKSPPVREREMQMAGSLIDSLSESVFEPEKFTDDYRDALEELIEAKVEGHEVTAQPAATTGPDTEVSDLLDALERSVRSREPSHGARTGQKTPSEKTPAKGAPDNKKAPGKKATTRRKAS